jgi:hypothetical protein
MSGSYYKNNRSIGQMKGLFSNMRSGIDTYKKSDVIGDNNLSDVWEASVDEATNGITLSTASGNSLVGSNATGTGKVINAIAAKNTADAEKLFLLTIDDADGDNTVIDDLVMYDESTNVKTVIDISSNSLTYTYTSMCLFSTESTRYVCFTASGTKKLMYYDFTSVHAIDIPFYPKTIVAHYNRVFVTDTGNKLWWCRAGDLTTWYGVADDDDRIVTSTNMLDTGTYTIAAQPDVPRPLTIKVTRVGTIDTLGTLTVVGTDSLDAAQTKTYTPIEGIYTTFDVWGSVTSITAAGHSPVTTVDTIKIGIAPVTGNVQQDAGMWTMEQEYTLVDMTVLGDSLYIWSPINIYVFQGYSYDTFSLTKIISNLGCYVLSNVTTCGNIAYFWGSTSDLYEYNGNEYPKIINRQVYVNGSIANGIYGSIPTFTNTPKLVAISGKLYAYHSVDTEIMVVIETVDTYYYQLEVYEFDTKSRSWWRKAGFVSSAHTTTAPTYLLPIYVANVAKDAVYNIFCEKIGAANPTWYDYTYMGNTATGGSYIVTKAFNDGISNDSSLTNIILSVRYVIPEVPNE